MTRPTPEWVSRAARMKVGEAIVTENMTQQAFSYHLRQLEGAYKSKSLPNGRQIMRVG